MAASKEKAGAAEQSGGYDAFPRREEFQKYLEKAGVIDQITRLLVNLYENPEKPDNALDYIRTFLGAQPAAVCSIDIAICFVFVFFCVCVCVVRSTCIRHVCWYGRVESSRVNVVYVIRIACACVCLHTNKMK